MTNPKQNEDAVRAALKAAYAEINTQESAEEFRPVSAYDNARTFGLALCCDAVHADKLEEIDDLRDRHAAYLNSLPGDPLEGVKVIEKLVGDEPDEGLGVAQHALVLIEEVVRNVELDGYPGLQKAIAWLASAGADAVRPVIERNNKASDICNKIREIQKEA